MCSYWIKIYVIHETEKCFMMKKVLYYMFLENICKMDILAAILILSSNFAIFFGCFLVKTMKQVFVSNKTKQNKTKQTNKQSD